MISRDRKRCPTLPDELLLDNILPRLQSRKRSSRRCRAIFGSISMIF